MVEIAAMAIDAATLSTREINALIRAALQGARQRFASKTPMPGTTWRLRCCSRGEYVFWAAWATTAAA